MRAAGERTFSFEGYTLDLARGSLRGSEPDIALRPKSFALWRYLVENAGRLLSKDDLSRAVWPNVIVTDESLARCTRDVCLALGDKEQRIIKTVPRRGYIFASSVSEPLPATPLGASENARSTSAPRLSIVVLPFANLGGDPAQDYFVDGVTESLTMDVSRISGSVVIGRSTAFTSKGKVVDLNAASSMWHCRMPAGVGAGSKSGHRSRSRRFRRVCYGSRQGNRGSCSRGAAPQSS